MSNIVSNVTLSAAQVSFILERPYVFSSTLLNLSVSKHPFESTQGSLFHVTKVLWHDFSVNKCQKLFCYICELMFTGMFLIDSSAPKRWRKVVLLFRMDQVEKFFSSLWIISKHSEHSGCHGFAVYFLDSSHYHTHVPVREKKDNLVMFIIIQFYFRKSV